MKILLVINSLELGGAEASIVALANFFGERGDEVKLLVLKDEIHPAHHISSFVRVLRLGLKYQKEFSLGGVFALPKMLFSLRQKVRKDGPDVVVSFMDQTNVLTLLATVGLGIPVIVSERVYPPKSSLRVDLQPGFLRWPAHLLRLFSYFFAKKIVILTRQTARCFPAFLQKKLVVIPNPVKEPPDRHKADFTLERPAIITMGRLHRQKNHTMLLSAFAELAARFPDWKLYIFGEGPLRQELEEQVAELNLTDRAFLPGTTGTPYDTLRQADLFVLPSLYEGFPNALAQAMACGLPVIATDCPTGPAELISNGENGVLIENSPQALIEALQELMSNEESRKHLGESARAIQQIFHPSRVYGEWSNLVHSVTQTNSDTS